MSIFPANDLIVDVARAADPVKRDLATRRLAALSQGADFAALAASPSQAPAHGPSSLQAQAPARLSSTTAVRASNPAAEPMKQFEAFVLQSFIELMLPKDAENIFGHGVAGDAWRSMLAEQMATRIAAAGGMGLGRVLAGGGALSRYAGAPTQQS